MMSATWKFEPEPISAGVQRYRISTAAGLLTRSDVLSLWQADECFVQQFSETIAQATLGAFRWETPPWSTERMDRPFEFVLVDDQLRTNVDGIWALGEVNGRGNFTHTSYNDFEIVAANVLDADSAEGPRKVTDRIDAYAVYIDPPLARIGRSEEAVKKSGRPYLVGKRPMTRVSRAAEKGETQGFLKIHVEEGSQRILGAALLGTGADEAVHSLIDAVYARTPYPEFQRRVRIHPTVSELLPTVLEDLKPLA